jgi:hypothetical protein
MFVPYLENEVLSCFCFSETLNFQTSEIQMNFRNPANYCLSSNVEISTRFYLPALQLWPGNLHLEGMAFYFSILF